MIHAVFHGEDDHMPTVALACTPSPDPSGRRISARRPPSGRELEAGEGEEPLGRFFEAVGHRPALEMPLAQERLAAVSA